MPVPRLTVCVALALTAVSSAAQADPVAIREIARAPESPTPFVCVAAIRIPHLDPAAPNAEWAGCDKKGSDPATTQSNPDHVSEITGAPSQFILVRMRAAGGLVAPAAAGQVQQVVVSAGSVTITRVATGALSADTLTVEVPLSDFSVLDNGIVATVRIDYVPADNNTRRASDTSYFTVRNKASWYGLASTGFGFWIPIGLFATNFKSTQDGIPFASFPVGIAWGARFFLHQDVYLGVSGMINYAIYPSTQNQMAAGSNTPSVNLQSGAAGGLLDVDGYAYVAGAYLADFRSNGKSPGGMFVLGLGPRLLQFLQSAKK